MKQSKSKSKRGSTKKRDHVLAIKTLKILGASEIRKKIEESMKPVFLLFGNERIELPSGRERMQFLKTLFEVNDLRTGPKESKTLTTQEVADLLNVSRPYVIKLIEDRKLKSHFVGSHRRIDQNDAIDFKIKMRNDQGEALDQLAEETQKLGLKFK